MNDDMTRIADATADRIDFLGQWLEDVERNYIEAVELGATEPVVLLLDGRDAHARAVAEAIAEGYGQGDQIDTYVAAAVDGGVVPALIWGVPRDLACDLLSGVVPEVGEELASAPSGTGYLAIVIAAGGYTIAPLPPVPAPPG